MNNQLVKNVTRLNQHETVFKHIMSFLRNKGAKSTNTERAYELDIRDFFFYSRNKSIEDLTEQDLEFRNSDMLDYQTFLCRDYVQKSGKKYSNVTINRKLNTIVSLYRFLKRNGYSVDPDLMKIEDLPNDSKQIGFLTVEEVEKLLASSECNELKSFITLALHTSMRKDSLLNLSWSQFEQKHDEPDYYIIGAMDKSKMDFKDIHVSVVNMLKEIKQHEGGRVFNISLSTLDYRFNSLCKKIGIDKNRKISIHSLRKCGIDFVKQYTGDLQAAQQQGTHSSPSVTAKIYTQKPKNLAARILIDKVDEKIFDEMTHEELLRLLKSFGSGVGYQLRVGARKIVNER